MSNRGRYGGHVHQRNNGVSGVTGNALAQYRLAKVPNRGRVVNAQRQYTACPRNKKEGGKSGK